VLHTPRRHHLQQGKTMKSLLVHASCVLSIAFALTGCTTNTMSDGADSNDSTADAVSRPRRVADFPELQNGLEALSAIASGGPSLEFFGYEEKAQRPAHGTCRSATAAEAAAAFDDVANIVMEEGDPGQAPKFTKDDLEKTKSAFRTYLGTGRFELCSSSGGGGMSFSNITTILGRGNAPRIALETAYED
jgi:hypothetical protein